jgi:hypothetical protein
MSRLDYDQRDLARKATLQAKAFDAEYDVRLRAITNRIIRAGRAIRLRGVLDPANVEYIKIQLTGPADRLTFLIDRIWQKLADVDPAMSKKLTSRAIQGETIVRNLKHIVDGVSDNTSNRIDDQEVLTRLIETLNILRGVDAEVNQMVETRLKEAKTKFKKRPRDFSMFDPPSEDRESPQVTQPS